jgi:[FeFe] hydrogenase H-cluster maturation GTPase HydF
MGIQNTPNANRLHIGLFGKRNSGKSSMINALTSQNVAIVSDVPGTTADPVYKPMELHGVGPVIFIDTAGFDDDGDLGALRVEKTKSALDRTDMAIVVFSAEDKDVTETIQWCEELKKRKIPVIPVINTLDSCGNDMLDVSSDIAYLKLIDAKLIAMITEEIGRVPLAVNAHTGAGIDKIKDVILELLPEDYDTLTITGNLVNEGDHVLLVMPQGIQAPKGRLILPQVQTIRELLDKDCVVTSVTADKVKYALDSLKKAPDLIITDSQIFNAVYELKPKESKLTSFSILFAVYKGDGDYFIEGARHLWNLNEESKILIAEACTHKPLNEDIGRVQLPRLLRRKLGESVQIDIVSGSDFPDDLTPYDLVITCGSCMFNRKHVMTRVDRAKVQHVPMSNYGIVLAYLGGILDKINIPK